MVVRARQLLFQDFDRESQRSGCVLQRHLVEIDSRKRTLAQMPAVQHGACYMGSDGHGGGCGPWARRRLESD